MRLAALVVSLAAVAQGFAPAVARPRAARLSAPLRAEGSVARCVEKITAAIAPTSLEVTNNEDDPNGSHIAIVVVSEAFEGLSRVKRQQLVMRSIKDEMDSGAIHAIDKLTTKTPAEVA